MKRREWFAVIASLIARRWGFSYRPCPLCWRHIDYSLWSHRKHFGIYHGGI